jgi:hypothetical protein
MKILLTILFLFSISLTATDRDELNKKKRALIEKTNKERSEKARQVNEKLAENYRIYKEKKAKEKELAEKAKELAEKAKAKELAEKAKDSYTQEELKQMKALKDKGYRVKKSLDALIEKQKSSSRKACSMWWTIKVKGLHDHRLPEVKAAKAQVLIQQKDHLNSMLKVKEYYGIVGKYLEVKKALNKEKGEASKTYREIKAKINNNRILWKPDQWDVEFCGRFDKYYKAKLSDVAKYEKDKKAYREKKQAESHSKKKRNPKIDFNRGKKRKSSFY